MKYVYRHISDDHSDNEWKTFLTLHNTTTINVGGHRQNLEAKAVNLTKDLSGWKVTGKRGRSGLKVANDPAEIDEELREVVECLLVLARGHPTPSKAAEPGVEEAQNKIEVLTVGGGMVVRDHPSMAEPTSITRRLIQVEETAHPSMAEPIVTERLIQAEDTDFKGGYVVVHDFDLNLDPLSTAMEDEDRS
ncbi:hypothetical protein L6452_03051 [Arctium lappa]|uniref:Uncharacterized protein n=1 Tax=Arctium lappa TaxID=4217 RepID=A0ACB9FM43_ARCLA|nr:hypothetical protein L6452_03051 [Arctium lappa]